VILNGAPHITRIFSKLKNNLHPSIGKVSGKKRMRCIFSIRGGAVKAYISMETSVMAASHYLPFKPQFHLLKGKDHESLGIKSVHLSALTHMDIWHQNINTTLN
jgi:hypothetical protein